MLECVREESKGHRSTQTTNEKGEKQHERERMAKRFGATQEEKRTHTHLCNELVPHTFLFFFTHYRLNLSHSHPCQAAMRGIEMHSVKE